MNSVFHGSCNVRILFHVAQTATHPTPQEISWLDLRLQMFSQISSSTGARTFAMKGFDPTFPNKLDVFLSFFATFFFDQFSCFMGFRKQIGFHVRKRFHDTNPRI